MKVSVQHEGRLMWLAQNAGLCFLTHNEGKAYLFDDITEAIGKIEANKLFKIPIGKYCFISEDGTKAWMDEAALLEPSNMISIDIDQKVELKPYQKNTVGRIGTGRQRGKKFRKECQPDASSVKGMVSCSSKKKPTAEAILASQLSDSLKKRDQEIKRLKKELESKKKPTVDEACFVLAKAYNMEPEAVLGSVHIMVSGGWHQSYQKQEPTSFKASDINDQFCLDMSKKIADFILDPARRKLVGIMAIEKAAGIPISTISNFISGKRDRIPLHHIGSIVKVLEVIGFNA